MDSGRGYRGWIAALTVAITLTLVFLAVEKHLRIPTRSYWKAPHSAQMHGATTEKRGILLTVDPGLASTQYFPPRDRTPIARRLDSTDASPTVGLLRRPPEPAASVILQAPIVSLELDSLPLHASDSNIDYLMDAMDRAFESPMQNVSVVRSRVEPDSLRNVGSLNTALRAPASIAGRIPEPTRLLEELAQLSSLIKPRPSGLISTRPIYEFGATANNVSRTEASLVADWILQTETAVRQLVSKDGLEHPEAATDLQQLAILASQAADIGNSLTSYELASSMHRAGYSLQRRIAVWDAIQGCLDGTTIGLIRPSSPELVRNGLRESLARIEERLGETGDSASWRAYLMLDQLSAWLASDKDVWEVGNSIAPKILSRLHWQRLSQVQKRFLSQPEFEDLASRLAVWGREPVDYRQLLTNLEQFEQRPTSRANPSVANSVQVLRHSGQPAQQLVAKVLNDHYRNANMRLSIASALIERFLPNGEHEIRPVRQRILGADTSGDSAIRTELSLKLIPDKSAWNVDLGVVGDMVSMTSSSKGPAVFHNTSTAQINSHRYLRIDPNGYRVSSEPTGVNSQDFLRKMSTDFDELPIIGDFVRLIVREQFEQKRSLAQRITRRIIAEEADAELDRRLESGLADAAKALNDRIVGPLQRFSLNPMVVSMQTTEDRLSVRYRVANEAQMAAFTPRPRAPSDALLSLQFHQSMVNNAIDQIGLSGREWTIPDLYQKLGEVFQQADLQVPADVPQDITIRFDDHHPATVELVDGRLRLSLRVLELDQPNRLHMERFVVTSNFIPVAEGLKAELLRDGVVEIDSKNRDRFQLRVIFASIFAANSQFPLVADSWQDDPRAEGLAVSQVEIRDGWLSVAISHSDSEQAAQVAERSRQLKLQ